MLGWEGSAKHETAHLTSGGRREGAGVASSPQCCCANKGLPGVSMYGLPSPLVVSLGRPSWGACYLPFGGDSLERKR